MTGRLAQIYRHPIKGHGREMLASVRLLAGEALPYDRHWAVAHEAAKLGPGWNRCANFARGAKAPQLMAVTAALNETTRQMVLTHPVRGQLTFQPDDPADLPRFLDWVRPLNPENRAQPVGIISTGVALTDSDFPSVSILNLASLADLSAKMAMDLSVDRWRGNLWLDGAAPWAEFDWIGRDIAIGGAVLHLRERITRCTATKVDPLTGHVDGDTLGALERAFGHQDFGVYATVLQGGVISANDPWRLL